MASGGLLTLKWLLLFTLLLCSALISGAEVALFGLSQTERNAIADENTKRGNNIIGLLAKPKKLLATILVTNNAINIGIVLLFSDLGDVLFKNVDYVFLDLVSARFLLEVVVATAFILMFGEILPKIYANRNRIQFSNFMAYPLRVLDVVFTPFSAPMRSATLFLQEKLGRQKSNLIVDQFSQALELTSEGDTTKEEQKILEGIVNFGNTDTKQVMCQRLEILALEH